MLKTLYAKAVQIHAKWIMLEKPELSEQGQGMSEYAGMLAAIVGILVIVAALLKSGIIGVVSRALSGLGGF